MTGTKSYTPKKEILQRGWTFIDVEGKILGRAATLIAKKLMGKEKAVFSTHINVGDKVVVINAGKIKVTGKKMTDKLYQWHTGFPKGLREVKLQDLMAKKPTEAIIKAVTNMLPNNKLRDERLANLYVYAGAEHPHKAQEKK